MYWFSLEVNSVGIMLNSSWLAIDITWFILVPVVVGILIYKTIKRNNKFK